MKMDAAVGTLKNTRNPDLPPFSHRSKTHPQSKQARAPRPGEYFPAEQETQGSSPIDAEYLPAPQGWHKEVFVIDGYAQWWFRMPGMPEP